MLGLTLAVAGRLDEAIARAPRDGRDARDGNVHAWRRLATRSARAGQARGGAGDSTTSSRRAWRLARYVSPVAFATILIGLGDVERRDRLDGARVRRSARVARVPQRESGARSDAWASALRGAREADAIAACVIARRGTFGCAIDTSSPIASASRTWRPCDSRSRVSRRCRRRRSWPRCTA